MTAQMIKLRSNDISLSIESLNREIKNSDFKEIILFLAEEGNSVLKSVLTARNNDLFYLAQKLKSYSNDRNKENAVYFNTETKELFYNSYFRIYKMYFGIMSEERIEEIRNLISDFINEYYDKNHKHIQRENFGISISFNDLADYCNRVKHRKHLKRIILSFGDGGYKPHMDILIKSIDENKVFSKIKFLGTKGEVVDFEYEDFKNYTKCENYLMKFGYNTDDIKFIGE